MTASGLIMLGAMTVVWLAGCALVCWKSPKARERVSSARLMTALLLVSALWVVLIPSANLLMAASGMLFGNAFILGGLLVAGVIVLDVLSKSTRTLAKAYGSVAARPGPAQ